MEDLNFTWWTKLQHGGMIISPAVLKELIPQGYILPPKQDYYYLRDHFLKFKSWHNSTTPDKNLAPLYKWLDVLLESFLKLNNEHWEKESQIALGFSYQTLIGENIKPNRIFFRNNDDKKPAIVLFIDRNPRIGMGKSRKQYGKTLEYLRNKKIKLGILTNGIQIRLCYAGLDHDSWVEWNIENWFEGTEFLTELYGFYTLLGEKGIYGENEKVFPLLDAIESSRSRQGELSAILGEQVRQSIELLLKEFSNTRERYPDITQIVRKNPDRSLISEEAELSAIFQAAVRIIMRIVVILFAEARHLLPRSNELYHLNYGIEGLFEQLNKAKSNESSDFLEQNSNGWYRLLSLFKLIYYGSPLPSLQVREYRGQLFQSGIAESYDPVIRALTIFEDQRFDLPNAALLKILEKLKYGKIKIRQGRKATFVKGPVDFRELRTEYIGMIYEGILDYELKAAAEPMLLLNFGLQPILPLSVLEGLSESQIKDLFEKMKEKNKTVTEEEEEELDEQEAEANDEENEEDEVEGVLEEEDLDEIIRTNEVDDISKRTQAWAEKAVLAVKLLKKPKRGDDQYLFNIHLKEKASALIIESFRTGNYYISRWGGTRKGTGTFYTRPQLAVPTVIRTLEPLCYTNEKPHILVNSSSAISEIVSERIEKYEAKAIYPRKPEEILGLKVCDPACGSGSFLVAATNYITEALFDSLLINADLMNPITAKRKILPFGKIIEKPDPFHFLPCPPDDDFFEIRVKAKLKRYVVENCIYGVDYNSTAVELAKMSLWVETMDRDLPFEFLDHKIKNGNSLVGAWLDTFHEYPLAAWLRDGGDINHNTSVHYEKEAWTKAIKKRFNSVIKAKMVELIAIRAGQKQFEFVEDIINPINEHAEILKNYNRLHTADVSIHGLEEKQKHYEELLNSASYKKIKSRMNLWCALWFWPGDKIDLAPDPVHYYNLSEEQNNLTGVISQEHKFFHWEIEFPDVFNETRSGFDAIVGNPPWEISKPNSKEFFSNIDPIYRTYSKQEALKHQIRLFSSNKIVEYNWLIYSSNFKALSNYVKNTTNPFGDQDEQDNYKIPLASGKINQTHHSTWRKQRKKHIIITKSLHPYKYQGSADLNTYKMFLEYFLALKHINGRIGTILPSSVHRDDGTYNLRRLFLDNLELLVKFDNEKLIFRDLEHNSKFDIIIIGSDKSNFFYGAFFSWKDTSVLENVYDFAIQIQKSDICKISPSTLSIPDLPTLSDYAIVKKLYKTGKLIDPNIKLESEFHLTNDSKLFTQRGKLPVYQGSMLWLFDYRYNYFDNENRRYKRGKLETTEFRPYYPINPKYWVNEESYVNKFQKRQINEVYHYEYYRIAFRIQSSFSNQRTFVNSIIPKNCSAGNSLGLILIEDYSKLLLLSILLSSLVNDFNVR